MLVSIYGDSISTYYGGYNLNEQAVYYTPYVAAKNGLNSAEDCWWSMVIKAMGGSLCVNNSISGCLVSDRFFSSGNVSSRCAALSSQGKNPCVIVVYMGVNDGGYGIPIGEDRPGDVTCFYGAYLTMLSRLKGLYPQAKIICGTLLGSLARDDGYLQPYNRAIRMAVNNSGCLLADIAFNRQRYTAPDGLHPDANGHKLIAGLFIKKIKEL